MRNKLIKTSHGTIETPAFFPDATYGTIKGLSWEELLETGTNQLVTTTLHLENKLGSEYIKKFGGIHRFFGWNNPILTDSGGYQVFSMIYRRNDGNNKISDAGCSFKDPDSGDFKFLSPEISQIVQYNLGADIVTVLDVPIRHDATTSEMTKSIEMNSEWAKRSKVKFLELHNLTESDFNNPDIKRPLLGAVIQGGNHKELRKQSAEELVNIGFDLYNYGGIPIHNEVSWHDDAPTGFNLEMLEYVSSLIPNDKIKYAMGVGSPDDIIASAGFGWDIFDTVIPTRNGRHGNLYVSNGVGDKQFKNYDEIHIRNTRYEFDENPVDPNCDCKCCKSISRAYLRHLIKIQDPVGWKFACIHNLSFYQKVISGLKK